MARSAPRAALGAVLLLAVPATRAPAVVWNVNPDGTGDAPTIQAAFDQASPGDLVLLAPGTYTGVRRRTIYGGVVGTAMVFVAPGVDLASSGGADVTILDAQFQGHCIVGDNLGAVEISGITFTRGTLVGDEYGYAAISGAGAFLRESGVILTDCVFDRCIGPNPTIDGASAIHLVGGASSVIRGCLFIDNYAGDIGGAVGIFEHVGALVENCSFIRNAAGDGGGAIEINDSSATMSNNIFALNHAELRAGAVLCLGSATVSGSCNLFWQNDAWVDPDMTASCSFLGMDDNINADPLFCGIGVDDFSISSDSPAAPGDPSGCGLRGALPVGCGPIRVEVESWGRIKGRYR